jgi:hypothetical protein
MRKKSLLINEIAYYLFFMDGEIKQLINQKQVFHGELQKGAIIPNTMPIIFH